MLNRHLPAFFTSRASPPPSSPPAIPIRIRPRLSHPPSTPDECAIYSYDATPTTEFSTPLTSPQLPKSQATSIPRTISPNGEDEEMVKSPIDLCQDDNYEDDGNGGGGDGDDYGKKDFVGLGVKIKDLLDCVDDTLRRLRPEEREDVMRGMGEEDVGGRRGEKRRRRRRREGFMEA